MLRFNYKSKVSSGKNLLFGFILVFFFIQSYSQKEFSNWYWGADGAGLRFTDSGTVLLTDGHWLYMGWTYSTFSDKYGNLLFYTEGWNVRNSKHEWMFNGKDLVLEMMNGGQPVMTIRQPGTEHIFYVFSTADGNFDNYTYSKGLTYSIINMKLDNGKGAVTLKNIKMPYSYTGGRITAIKHSGGKAIWIIFALEKYKMGALLFNENGLSSNLVISNIDSSFRSNLEAPGMMRSSPDGSIIATSSLENLQPPFYPSYKELNLYHFNNQSGEVTEWLTDKGYTLHSQGIEFSPDSRFLYVMHDLPRYSHGDKGIILQYDLQAGSADSILYSREIIVNYRDSVVQHYSGGPNLGIDGKIYITTQSDSFIHVINYPNMKGSACGFSHRQITLDGRRSGNGLPYNVPLVSNEYDYSFSGKCDNDSFYFNYEGITPDSVLWDFGDSISGYANYSTQINSAHLFSSSGNYQVSLYVYNYPVFDTVKKNILVYPSYYSNSDTVGCGISNLYLLNRNISNPGYYCDSLLTDSGCDSVISYNVYFDSMYYRKIDTSICEGQTLLLAGSDIRNPGIYYDSLKTQLMCDSVIEYNVIINNLPKPYLGNDTVICMYDTTIRLSPGEFVKYRWYPLDDTTSELYITEEGSYIVEVMNENLCENSDTINILNRCYGFFIPNAFSPNNDGLNEVFIPILRDKTLKYDLVIYNRWGELVFSTNDPTIGWDGSFKGKKCPEGIYVYMIKVQTSNNRERIYKGTVALLR